MTYRGLIEYNGPAGQRREMVVAVANDIERGVRFFKKIARQHRREGEACRVQWIEEEAIE